MKLRAARWGTVCILVLLLTGCQNDTADVKISMKEAASEAELKARDQNEFALSETEAEEEPESTDSDCIYTEDEINLSVEDGQSMEAVTDAPPVDTVEYVESDREEMTKIVRTESVVDENDPSTYQVVLKETEIQVTEEVPEEYTDSAGNVRYACVEGIWYEYRYSTGDITMSDKADEETALALLNLFGEYDDFEVVKIECSEIVRSEANIEYAYHVLYRRAVTREEAPAEVEGLTVTKTRQEIRTEKKMVEEKVPVMLEKESGTGTYIYYGWQELDGHTFYFDKNGEKVTGEQVIKGIRCLFDENGVLLERSGVDVSSRNGDIDWERVRNTGIDFALIRCGYRGASGGMLVSDSRCEENIEGAKTAGMEVGIYFYSQAVTEKEALQEADFLVSMAGKYGITSPLILSLGNTRAYSGRAEGLSMTDRTAYVKVFCDAVQKAGYTPAIYGNGSWLAQSLDVSVWENCSLWLAQYNPNVTYAGVYDIWQYTAKGTVDGINGTVGLNMKNRRKFQ